MLQYASYVMTDVVYKDEAEPQAVDPPAVTAAVPPYPVAESRF